MKTPSHDDVVMASIIMCLAIYLLFVKSYLLVCVPNGQNSEPDIKKKKKNRT